MGRRDVLKASLASIAVAVPAASGVGQWTHDGADRTRSTSADVNGEATGLQRSVPIERARPDQSALRADGECCAMTPPLLTALGITPGEQVRIRRSAEEYAAYTVLEAAGQSPVVYVGEPGRRRLGTPDTFEGTVTRPVPRSELSDERASRRSEFVERLEDPGGDDLVVLAPHGGWIEPHTDDQADRVADRLAGATAWRAKGWRDGGGAYDRWHVTSTAIHPRSFPALGRIVDRGFTHAVGFHGFSEAGIVVGGGAPAGLRGSVRDALEARLPASVPVRLATDATAAYGGDDPDNLTNWLTADGRGGIQIEQSRAVRDDHRDAVADAVVAVFG